MIRLGPMSVVLLAFAAQAMVLAVALAQAPANRRANRYLAALLVVIAGLLTPYIIGYAGFYDAYPWLSFAPFAMPLAIGPLIYGHVRALVADQRLPLVHFLLPGAHFLYQAVCFTLPLATKNAIDGNFQRPYLDPVMDLLILGSLAGYGWAGWQASRRYGAWLAERRRSLRPARRVQRALGALVVLLAAEAAYDAWDRLVAPTDYFDRFAFYLMLSLLAAYLGIEGWRQAHDPAPPLAEEPRRDWHAQGAAWLATMREAGWASDPALSVADLARRLGTNSGHLSRALNDGHGGFADAVARIRAERVAARIDAGESGDLLGLALEAGFGSKASFNRAFKARFGMTPSAYRAARVANAESSRLPGNLRRAPG